MDIEDTINNLIVGSLILAGIYILVFISVLIEIYANWLGFIGFGCFVLLSYEIGRYVI